MAATGKTPILLYGSTTATNTPSAGNLTNSSDGCEIAINVADKNLFFKDSTNAVNTVPIRQSSASSNGWLSSTDWSTFNSKQPAGTYVTSVTGTAPVVSSGGTTPAISMAAANGSTNGYLTSTDWTTFNSKAPAFTYTNTYVPYGQGTTTPTQSSTFTYNGTQLTAGNFVPGSSTIPSVGAYLPAANSFGIATNSTFRFVIDAAGLVGIGLTPYSSVGGNGNKLQISDPTTVAGSGLTIGSTTTGDIQFSDAASGSGQYAGLLRYVHSTDTFSIWTNSASKFTINSGGDATVSAGNLVIGTSGKGIDFSATAGTGTSELLADYEEGTWTPTLTGSTTNPTVTYSIQRGLYTKVGRQVTVSCYITWTAYSGGSGNSQISGLPYTIETATGTYGGAAISQCSGLNYAASRTWAGLMPISGTTSLRYQTNGSGVASAIAAVSDMTASGTVMFTASYFV